MHHLVSLRVGTLCMNYITCHVEHNSSHFTTTLQSVDMLYPNAQGDTYRATYQRNGIINELLGSPCRLGARLLE